MSSGDRLLSGDVAAAFFDAVTAQARTAGLLSDEHVTVDGTQLEAWASLKSVQRRDAGPGEPSDDPGNPTVHFHGESRRNDTHESTTDPEAMLHRKGKGTEAKLAYLGHVLLDNRQGLVANVCATHATGTAEREAAAVVLVASAPPGSTVGADKGYDVASFVAWRCPHPRRSEGPVECDRWPDDAACGVSRQSAQTEARRTGLWVTEDRRRVAQAPAPRHRAGGLATHLRRHGV